MIRRGLLLLLLAAPPAAAQDAIRARGIMEATAYAALPAGAPLAIRPSDGSRASADIAAILAERLRALGHAADPGAMHQLSFRIGDLPGATVARPPDIELRGSLGSEGNEDAAVVLRMQMLDRAPAPQRTRTRLLVIEIADRTGKPYWAARIEASGATDDDVALVEALAPHVFARLGEPAYALQLPEPSR